MGELISLFRINVFAPVALIQAVLPSMRERRTGQIVNVTSTAGLAAFPALSCYCGAKFALQGITEALAAEIKTLGIRVTALAPSQFRTDWGGRSLRRSPRKLTDYDAIVDPLRRAQEVKSGTQPGDPRKAGAALLRLVNDRNPPLFLLLGADAEHVVRRRLKQMD